MSLLISLKMFLSTTVEILQEYTLWVNTYSKLTIRATSICLVYFPYVSPKFQGKSAPLVLIESINNQEQHLCWNERAQNSVIIYLVGNNLKKGDSKNKCFRKARHVKFSEKRTFLTPWYAHFCIITGDLKVTHIQLISFFLIKCKGQRPVMECKKEKVLN